MAVSENDLIVGPLTPAAGVTTISLDFYFEQASWLEVYKSGSETPLVFNTDYTVTGAGTGSGVVTLAVAANGTDAYSVYLIVPLQRSSDMQLRGEFKSDPFNIEMDRIWQAIQGINTRVAQSLRISRTSLVVGPLATGSAAARAGRALVFGASGSDLGIGPTAAEIASAQSFAASAGTSATEAADSAASAGTSATEAADSAASAAASAAGDVEGPASATNNHVALFNGATGKLIKSGGFAFTAAGQAIAAATDAAAQRATLGAAALASPTFTGVPAAPTAAAATNTTQLATTEFVTAAVTAKGVQGGTIAATTSGTTFDFTSIPAAVQEVKILFNSVSLTGGDSILIQIGDGANRTTGYVATSASTTGTAGSNTNSTSGFPINGNEALSGVATLTRLGAGSNIWVFDSTARRTTTEMVISGGVKTLSGELDRVRITRTGTNTFDLGSVNVVWR